MLKYDRRCKGMEAVYLFFDDDFLYKTSLYILCKHPLPWPYVVAPTNFITEISLSAISVKPYLLMPRPSFAISRLFININHCKDIVIS